MLNTGSISNDDGRPVVLISFDESLKNLGLIVNRDRGNVAVGREEKKWLEVKSFARGEILPNEIDTLTHVRRS